jgi:hypothetical protein
MTKLLSFACLLFLFSINTFSQKIITTLDGELPPEKPVTKWEKKNIIGFDISENTFVNWNSGGTNSFSGLLKGNFSRILASSNYNWDNELIVRYGLNKQDGLEVRKTEDAIQFNSTFGYRHNPTSNWFHSAKLNFKSQFSDGYKYPDKDNPVSKPFAPAYIFLGAGAEYASKDKKIKLYISPFTLKTTLVLDQTLADQGAFGVKKAVYDVDGNLILKGERSRDEFGFLFTSNFKSEIIKNVVVENRVSLYSDYINNFGNIDVDYDLTVNLIVNQYIRTNIGAHILYDDDIKTKEKVDGEEVLRGPKTQLKQVLGVGLVYDF